MLNFWRSHLGIVAVDQSHQEYPRVNLDLRAINKSAGYVSFGFRPEFGQSFLTKNALLQLITSVKTITGRGGPIKAKIQHTFFFIKMRCFDSQGFDFFSS